MSTIASVAIVAALIGEPARTAMLLTLMDGRALTASELAEAAGVTPPTASGHLAQLLDAGLLSLQRQGRHRYYRLASVAVAAMLESMMSLSGELGLARVGKPIATGPRDKALRRARVCYNHLAGAVAVGIADSMAAREQLVFAEDGGALSESGSALLLGLGVELARVGSARQGSTFCRPCLDWSERRSHIGGEVGRQMYAAFVRKGWLRQPEAGRAVAITPAGLAAFEHHFGFGLSSCPAR